MRRNLGHQRAICVAICYIRECIPCDLVVVMDADGEDRPQDVPHLIRAAQQAPEAVVFAERQKRFEGSVFKIGYAGYRLFHRLLTGVSVRVGNFSAIPARHLARITCMSELWNHYAGAVFKSRVPMQRIKLDRGQRIHGKPQMNVVSLIAHGIAGFASFREEVATRILVINGVGLCVLVAGLIAVFAVRFFTNLAIPGWATSTAGLIAVILIQLLGVSFSLVFSLIVGRMSTTFIPFKEYSAFVDKLDSLTEQ